MIQRLRYYFCPNGCGVVKKGVCRKCGWSPFSR